MRNLPFHSFNFGFHVFFRLLRIVKSPVVRSSQCTERHRTNNQQIGTIFYQGVLEGGVFWRKNEVQTKALRIVVFLFALSPETVMFVNFTFSAPFRHSTTQIGTYFVAVHHNWMQFVFNSQCVPTLSAIVVRRTKYCSHWLLTFYCKVMEFLKLVFLSNSQRWINEDNAFGLRRKHFNFIFVSWLCCTLLSFWNPCRETYRSTTEVKEARKGFSLL